MQNPASQSGACKGWKYPAGYNKSSLAATAGRYRKVVNSVWQKSICRMAKPWKVLYGALNARFNKKILLKKSSDIRSI